MTNVRESTIPSPLRVLGTEIRVHLDQDATGGGYTAYRCTVPAGVGAPLHRHEGFDEAFVVLQGTFEIRCGDASLTLGPGDSAFAPRGAVHAFKNVGEGPAVYVGIATPGGHERFFEEADRMEGPLTPESVGDLCARNGIELV